MKRENELLWTTEQVANIAGLSLRQLQWWDEHGIVVPIKAKKRRHYTTRHLAAVLILARLKELGFMPRLAASRILNSVLTAMDEGNNWCLVDVRGDVIAKGTADSIKDALSTRLMAGLIDLARIRGLLCPPIAGGSWFGFSRPVSRNRFCF